MKSPEWRMTPCDVCTAIAWACGTEWVTGMNSTSNGPIVDVSTVVDGDQLGATEQPGLLDAVAGEPERQRRAVDRQRPIEEVADPVVSRSRNWMPPTWSSWPWVADQPGDPRRRSRAGT